MGLLLPISCVDLTKNNNRAAYDKAASHVVWAAQLSNHFKIHAIGTRHKCNMLMCSDNFVTMEGSAANTDNNWCTDDNTDDQYNYIDYDYKDIFIQSFEFYDLVVLSWPCTHSCTWGSSEHIGVMIENLSHKYKYLKMTSLLYNECFTDFKLTKLFQIQIQIQYTGGNCLIN